MTHGKEAADALALKYSLADAKLENIGPMRPKRQPSDKSFESTTNWPKRSARDPKGTQRANPDRRAKETGTLGITFNAAEAVRTAVQSAIEKLANKTDPRAQKLAIDAKLNIKAGTRVRRRKIDAMTEQVLADSALDSIAQGRCTQQSIRQLVRRGGENRSAEGATGKRAATGAQRGTDTAKRWRAKARRELDQATTRSSRFGFK